MVANNADDPPFASIISTTTYTVVGQITFDGSNGARTPITALNSASGVPGPGNSTSRSRASSGIRTVKAAWQSSTRRLRRLWIPLLSPSPIVRRRKEWLWGRTIRSCWAATHRLPMGTRTPLSSTRIAGRSLEGSRTLGVTTKSGTIQATATTSSPKASSPSHGAARGRRFCRQTTGSGCANRK